MRHLRSDLARYGDPATIRIGLLFEMGRLKEDVRASEKVHLLLIRNLANRDYDPQHCHCFCLDILCRLRQRFRDSMMLDHQTYFNICVVDFSTNI